MPELIETTPKGGRQTAIAERCDLLPPAAILIVARVMKIGAEKYGPDNWRMISSAGHINHALTHLFRYLLHADDADLEHAATRLLMALETR